MRTTSFATGAYYVFSLINKSRNRNIFILLYAYLEPPTGIEPATYCLQGSRTANCATGALW